VHLGRTEQEEVAKMRVLLPGLPHEIIGLGSAVLREMNGCALDVEIFFNPVSKSQLNQINLFSSWILDYEKEPDILD
jgi:hypothetical protein